MALAGRTGALVQRVHEQERRVGHVAVLVVLLFGHSARHGLVGGVGAAGAPAGAEDPVAGVAAGAVCPRLLAAPSQGVALHRLHLPAVERGRRHSLQSIVSIFLY